MLEHSLINKLDYVVFYLNLFYLRFKKCSSFIFQFPYRGDYSQSTAKFYNVLQIIFFQLYYKKVNWFNTNNLDISYKNQLILRQFNKKLPKLLKIRKLLEKKIATIRTFHFLKPFICRNFYVKTQPVYFLLTNTFEERKNSNLFANSLLKLNRSFFWL